MNQQKLTPWFVNGEKPLRPGVYNVSCQRSNQSGDWWSHWDGEDFGPFELKPEKAFSFRKCWEQGPHAGTNLLLLGSWRGLAENPE